ncbi:hypothetical protein Q75_16070 [Bacillus coahuilensis p1.1.43]|uniref:EpsG family protein n=2 Tax=Bacillus coahuilensis TaxID=408580 RepID=A0A147K4J5_9BACI|nr:hypothetical protein Q75_16070 [Bacillus coahuilensis p1.1.43]
MSYYRTYEAINAGQLAWGSSDILYKSLNLLIPNFYLFVAIISLFYLLVIFFLIKNNLHRKQYWFSILILLINPYLFLIHLSSLRQTIAMCFIVIAVHFATKRNPIMYFLFVLIAMGFHQSALIMVPVYFLLNQNKLNVVKTTAIIGTLFLLLLTPLFDTIIRWVLDYFPRHYSYYYEQGLQNSLRSTFISSFFFFLILFNINKLNGKELLYGKLSLIATIISLLAYKVSMITRIGMYFDIFLIVTLPLLFSKMKKGKIRVILFAALLGIYILRYWSFFNNEVWIDAYRTYQTILTK